MKKIIFILILSSISILAQSTNAFLHIAGDTTDLKNANYSGVVLLLRYGGTDNTGGGFFIRQDSAYPEGTNAFSYLFNGYQWVRMNLTDKYVTPATSTNQALLWSGTQYNPYTVAGVDSFKTTTTADTLVNSTFTSTDKFSITNWQPSYSATPDSVRYSYRVVADTCFITRESSTGTFKSGGQYSWIRFK